MAAKLLHIVAVATLAVFLSAGPQPVSALSIDSHSHVHARHALVHDSVVKKRANGRCKPRKTPTPKPTQAPASTKSNPPPAETPKPNNPAPPPASGKGNKACLAWANGDNDNLGKFKTNKVSYIYSWSPWVPKNAKKLGFRPAPMLWGDKHINDFQKLVKAGYADIAVGFNEPDHSDQANMDPWHAADVWKKYIEPLKNQGYRLVSPAVTNGPSGKPWFRNFLKACNGGCTMDAHAIHFYDTIADNLINYVQEWHSEFQKPIWITEFACTSFGGRAAPNAGQVREFMGQVTNFFDNTWYVEAYCPFGAMAGSMTGVNENNRLMNPGNGNPTDLYWGYAG